MCGIAGLLRRSPAPREELESNAQIMRGALRHRGPDMSGVWVHPAGLGALGFARLAIQDLSPEANQPMHSESGRYVLVFNGEVYNTDELRDWAGRSAPSFRTHSDTEVLLACIDKFGLEATLKRANAMLALALWDLQTDSVFLARDRLGKKPLHYAVTPDEVCFGSEIKAVLQRPVPRELSAEAIHAYFALTYIPAPLTIWRNVRKVRPGQVLEIRADLRFREWPYWSLDELIATRRRAGTSFGELVEEADSLLADAVRRRLVSDVPVGLLLSGGVDSGLIASALSKARGRIKAFTVSLEDKALDEAAEAQAIASKLGIEHTVLALRSQDGVNLARTAVEHLDEPFGDPSCVPTYAICELAKEHATVLLTGDGGDEVFGGYTRYLWAMGARRVLAHVYAAYRSRGRAFSTVAVGLELYRRLMTVGMNGGSAERSLLTGLAPGYSAVAGSLLDGLRYLDFLLYLPDDILVKTDRMSMANAVELRSPFLDHRLVEFSWRLPDPLLVSGNTRKVLSREMFARSVGAEFLQPKKHGFALAIGHWLTEPLRNDVEDAFQRAAQMPGLPLDIRSLRREWAKLNPSDMMTAYKIWVVYAFHVWSKKWAPQGAAAAS